MDVLHTWWTPLVEKIATAIGGGIFSGASVAILGWMKRTRESSKLEDLCLDIENLQKAFALQAGTIAALEATCKIYAEDRNRMERFNRDIGRLEGRTHGFHEDR